MSEYCNSATQAKPSESISAELTTTNEYQLETLSIHSGTHPDPTTGAILTPIYQTATYAQEKIGIDKGYTYSRTTNPTVTALEQNLAALEQVDAAVCFATGMAAITTLFLALLKSGDHIIYSDVIYGGTTRLLRDVLSKFNVSFSAVDGNDPKNFLDAITPHTRLILIETPGNPTLKLTDIAAVAHIAKKHGILLAVDNTFLTPALQQPFKLGADIVMHSTTKYIDGHNATVGGALLAQDTELIEIFRYVRNSIGAIQSPLDAWLTLQGVKTLPLRMRQHSANALKVAQFLEAHPKIKQVRYPGLKSFPQHSLATAQQLDHGGMLAFQLDGSFDDAITFMHSVRLCTLAESLGSVETLITHPASMTHHTVPLLQRQAVGISDDLIRLSVGLENVTDIINDLSQALNCCRRAI